MSYDGNGQYDLPTPQYPAISGEIIRADYYNDILTDLASALSTVLVRDGQAAMTGNLPMGSKKITGMANGNDPQDAVTFLQVFTSPDFTDATMLGATFTVSATATVIGGTTFTVTSTTVTLPAATSIGNVSSTEIGYLDGVTSGLQGQLDAKASLVSPAFSGNPTTPTPPFGDRDTSIANTKWVGDEFAPLASPNFSGAPTTPTPADGDLSLKVANTEFVYRVAYGATLPSPLYVAGNYNLIASSIVALNSTAGSFTITLPAAPALGASVRIIDVGQKLATNPVTLARNGGTGTIMGKAENCLLNVSSIDFIVWYNGSEWRFN